MRTGRYNAKDRQEALAEAEKQLVTPAEGQKTVKLKPQDIGFKLALFQPREFFGGLKKTDGKTVRELAHSIGIYGELDPPLVIKLGEEFVCVDGHHRLEAYKKKKWTQPISCEWFARSVQEAVDESMRRNAKTKLNVPKADKMEEAWKRVLLDQGSKEEIARLCDVSPSSVANMRKVKACDGERGERRDELRCHLGLDEETTLLERSWSSAWMAWNGMERNTITEEEEAKALAQRIGQKMEGLLSRNPKVTARALELYDPELPKGLMEVWEPFMHWGDPPADIGDTADLNDFLDPLGLYSRDPRTPATPEDPDGAT